MEPNTTTCVDNFFTGSNAKRALVIPNLGKKENEVVKTYEGSEGEAYSTVRRRKERKEGSENKGLQSFTAVLRMLAWPYSYVRSPVMQRIEEEGMGVHRLKEGIGRGYKGKVGVREQAL